MSPIALIHVCGAVIGLLSGFMALSFRKGTNLLYVPAVILVGVMILWMYRVKRRRPVREETPFTAGQDDVLVRKAA